VPHASNRRAVGGALCCALILAAAPARAQAPADFKPYTETIQGTGLTFNLVPIPGGTYKMGSPDSEAKRGEDESPVHEVKIAPFWMGAELLEPRVERPGPPAPPEHLVAHRRDVRRLPGRLPDRGARKSQGVQVPRGEGQGDAIT
jgi:hypothetical protein